MNSELLLEVNNLKVEFNKHQVLKNIDFKLNRGEVISIIGRSGSGKTVLLRTLARLLTPKSGDLKFYFRSKSNSPIGFAFQKSPLFPWLSISENLNLCAASETERQRGFELLKNVGLENFKDHYPQNISGGMAQKVNLLRALSHSCELILMDEPFGSLDSFQRSELQQFTHNTCRSEDRSIILITHDIDEAILLSDRIHILSSKSGTLTEQIKVDIKKPDILINMRSDPDYNKLFHKVNSALIAAEAIL